MNLRFIAFIFSKITGELELSPEKLYWITWAVCSKRKGLNRGAGLKKASKQVDFSLSETVQKNALEKRPRPGIDQRVHFFGFVDDETKRQLLNVADVFVLASEHEGLGIVLLEAIQMGLPIAIRTAEGGQNDILQAIDYIPLSQLATQDQHQLRLMKKVQSKSYKKSYGRMIEYNVKQYEDFLHSQAPLIPCNSTKNRSALVTS